MIYKQFGDLSLSALGLGCMRLPVVGEGDHCIDEAATAAMVEYAMQKGINYYDTAWGYHGGNSETVMGKILKKYPRDSFYLASKFPGYDLSLHGKIEEIFEKQLEKCQVSYFDFYLIHSVTSANIDLYLDPKCGTLAYVLEQKRNGRIRHLGFSFHGNEEVMRRFLEVYGDYMEFGQLQLNWLDWSLQNAKTYVSMLRERNIPVWVMEPVRGGRLAALPGEQEAELRALRPKASMPEWAFRFLQTVPEVVVTLSGMSNFEQLRENIEIYSSEQPLTAAEWETLMRFAERERGSRTLSCTACRYCVDHCPQALNIPHLIALYNKTVYSGEDAETKKAIAMPEGSTPAACIACGACVSVCPQGIDIPSMMRECAAKW